MKIFMSIVLMLFVVCQVIESFELKATDPEVLKLFAQDWTSTAQQNIKLMEERLRLKQEVKRLQDTIEPRSFQKGVFRGRVAGISGTLVVVFLISGISYIYLNKQ